MCVHVKYRICAWVQTGPSVLFSPATCFCGRGSLQNLAIFLAGMPSQVTNLLDGVILLAPTIDFFVLTRKVCLFPLGMPWGWANEKYVPPVNRLATDTFPHCSTTFKPLGYLCAPSWSYAPGYNINIGLSLLFPRFAATVAAAWQRVDATFCEIETAQPWHGILGYSGCNAPIPWSCGPEFRIFVSPSESM